MGRHTDITKENVFSAINTIIKKKQNPTIEKIRLLLGSGSNSTISKYLADWKGKPKISPFEKSELTKAYDKGFNEAIKMMQEFIKKNIKI